MRPDERASDGWRELEEKATALATGGAPTGVLGGSTYWWVVRGLLPLVLTAALAVEYEFLPFDGCTVADPCLPRPGWSLLEGLLLGALAAAWLVPDAALPLVGLAALPFVVEYAVLGELGTVSGVAALAQLVVALAGTGFVLARRRRRLPPAVSARLPGHGRDVVASRGVGTVEVAVVVGLAAAAGLLGWFVLQSLDTRDHLSRAQATDVEVVAVDDYDWLLEVRVPGTRGVSEVGVYDVEEFAVGDRVAAHVDTTVEPAWVSLDAEPVEHDGWLVLAGALAVLGATVGADRGGALRHRRRLLTEGGPVWSTTAAPGGDGARVLLPGLGLRAPLARALPFDELLEDVGLLRHDVTADPLGHEPVAEPDDAEAEELRQDAFVAAWRGDQSVHLDGMDGMDDLDDLDAGGAEEPVVLIGDPRPGGVVVVITPDVVLAPYGPLRPMSPLDVRRLRVATRPRGGPEDGGPDQETYDATGLPGSVAVPSTPEQSPRGPDGRRVAEVQLGLPRRRRLAAAALLLLPAAFWLTADGSLPPEEQLTWFQSVGVLFGAGSVGFGGLAYARASTHLRVDGVHVAAHGFAVVHPWQHVVGLRVIGEDVVAAFGVDADGDLDAVGGPPVGLDPAGAAGLAARWHAEASAVDHDDAPGPRRSVDPLVGGGVVLYALAAGATVLWPLLHAAA